MKKCVAALAIFISITSSAMAQQENEGGAVVNQYYYCVARVTNRDPSRFINPEVAVERGFGGCQTEEFAIRAYASLQDIPAAQIEVIIAAQRGKIKKAYVEKLIELGRSAIGSKKQHQ